MFERFTDRARRVVVLAQEEARKYKYHALRQPVCVVSPRIPALRHQGEQ